MPVGDIFRHRTGKQKSILKHNAYPTTKRLQPEIAEVLSACAGVEPYLSGAGIVKTRQQHQQRGFPGTRCAHYRHRFTGVQGKGDIAEDASAATVLEAHILQLQPDNLTVNRLRPVFHLRTGVDQSKHALHGRLGALGDNQKRCQYTGWPGQHREEAGKRHEGAEIDATVHNRPAAVAQQDDLPEHR